MRTKIVHTAGEKKRAFAYIAVKMPPQSGKLGCADCAEKRKLNDVLKRKQRKARKPSKKMTLDETLKEIARYNETHGTDYNYGYYSALKFRGLI